MGTSFSSQGSTAGNPTKGLLGNMSKIPQFNSPQNPGLVKGVLAPNMNTAPKTNPGLLPAQSTQPITGFVPGTQKPLPTPWNRTISGADVPGTPTAAGNTKLQGSEYFQGLLNSQNPSERQAGQTWLSHQATPGLLPQHPVSSITTSPDGTTKHTFDTKGTDGSTNGSTGTSSTTSTSGTTTGTNPGLLPSGPKVGTPTQNAQNVLDTSNLNNNPEYRALAQQNGELVKEQQGAPTAGIGGTPIPGVGTNNANYQNLFTPQTTASLQGRENQFNTNNSIQMTGNAAEAGRLLSGAQLATGGAENVLGASTYSPTSYGLTNTSGLTGVQDSGQYGTGPAAAANVQSIKDLQGAYNQGLVNLKAADGIQNQIVSTLQSNPQLNTLPISAIANINELLSGQISSGPQQLLSQQIHQYIQTLGLDPATVTNIAHQQQGTLAQLLDSLRQTAQTQNDAKNPASLNIKGSSNSKTSGGSTGGTIWDF